MIDVIKESGGLNKEADLRGIVFKRNNLKYKQVELARKNNDRDIKLLEGRLASGYKQSEADQQTKMDMISMLKDEKGELDNKYTGQIALNIKNNDLDEISKLDNVELQDGDDIYIPRMSNQVSIIGEVYNEQSFIYKSGAKAKSYIKQVGGYTPNANNFSHISKQFHFLNDEYQIISSTISSSESSFLDNKIILFDNFTEQHRLLFDLLATTNNKLNEKLYKAVLWLGKSLQTKNLDDCFLQVAIALECLLSRTEKGYFIQPSITVNLAETLTFLIAKTKEDRIKIFKDLKNLYGKRSAIVHNGSATIDFETYNKFFIYVKSGIYSLLELVKQKGIKSIDDVYNYVETAKFS